MKDAASKPRGDKDKSAPSSGYRNVSELESSVDVQCVYETIMGQTVVSFELVNGYERTTNDNATYLVEKVRLDTASSLMRLVD